MRSFLPGIYALPEARKIKGRGAADAIAAIVVASGIDATLYCRSSNEKNGSAVALIAKYESKDFSGVDALWSEAFPNDTPWNAAATAILEKTRFQPDLMLVALDGDRVIGSVMAGYEGHRGWISRIAVLRSHQNQGVGQELLTEAEHRLAALGCIKVNLQVVESNSAVVEFYERSGYRIEPRISMSKHLT